MINYRNKYDFKKEKEIGDSLIDYLENDVIKSIRTHEVLMMMGTDFAF